MYREILAGNKDDAEEKFLAAPAAKRGQDSCFSPEADELWFQAGKAGERKTQKLWGWRASAPFTSPGTLGWLLNVQCLRSLLCKIGTLKHSCQECLSVYVFVLFCFIDRD